jgi:LmbE family N-acetylglucosaminyl deacetylase
LVFVEERPPGGAGSGVIKLSLPAKDADSFVVLCLGAHSDDIEIGCGGTVLHLKTAFPRSSFHWVVFSAPGLRGQEASKAAELFTAGCSKKIVLKDYRDGFLPYSGREVKDFFEELKGQVNPDLILTHWRDDAHQDHRLIAELTWNTFRDHLILEYEIPKYDGDLGQPGLFVPLQLEVCRKKVGHILDAFQSQHAKRWFQEDTFMSLMRLRGMECNSPSGHAEAFHCRKLLL